MRVLSFIVMVILISSCTKPDGYHEPNVLESFNESIGLKGSYTGEYKNNAYHGQGVLSIRDLRYEGEFVNGKRHGYGTETLGSGYEKKTYLGKWKDDLMHGQGTLTWEDVAFIRKFSGEFLEGKPFSGAWTMLYDTRTTVENLQNGRKHGQTVTTWKNGTKLAFEYDQGLLGGPGSLACSNGRKGMISDVDAIEKDIPPDLCTRVIAEKPKFRNLDNLLQPYKRECANLGFKVGTEAFGSCVLRLRESILDSHNVMGDGSSQHRECQSLGFKLGSSDYAQCRQELRVLAR
jgi:hypothetical protein